jgi:hypothetical protein
VCDVGHCLGPPNRVLLAAWSGTGQIIRILKAWAWMVGRDPDYAKRVSVSDALAMLDTVIEHDLLRDFDRPEDPQALKRRALERAAQRRRRPCESHSGGQ